MDRHFYTVEKNVSYDTWSVSVICTVLLVLQVNDVFFVIVLISLALLITELLESPKNMLSVCSIFSFSF